MFTINKDLCVSCGSCISACPVGIFHREEDGSVAAHQKECLDCCHCAAACPAGAICRTDGQPCCAEGAPEGSLLGKFQRRRSIRRFRDTTPDAALIRDALNGAAYAPSAKNQQVCCWTVVLGKDKVEELYQAALVWAKTDRDFRHLVWLARHGSNPVTCGAPCLILVHAPADSHNPQIDAAVAMTLAEQLLADSGLGTCWGGYLARMAERSAELRAMLSIPEGHQVLATLMVGHPDERYLHVPHRPEARINWVE